MSYWTNKLAEEPASLIGRSCWYKKPYNTNIISSPIKEVDIRIKQNVRGTEVIATLANGTTAVLHTYGCPDYVGRAVWGFLTKAECEEYWDM